MSKEYTPLVKAHPEVRVAFDMVWDMRYRVRDRWPTPSKLHSMQFALTEIAEAVDAQLRQDKSFVRTNDKPNTIEAELADTVIMLVTCLGSNWRGSWNNIPKRFPNAEATMGYLAYTIALINYRMEQYDWGQYDPGHTTLDSIDSDILYTIAMVERFYRKVLESDMFEHLAAKLAKIESRFR